RIRRTPRRRTNRRLPLTRTIRTSIMISTNAGSTRRRTSSTRRNSGRSVAVPEYSNRDGTAGDRGRVGRRDRRGDRRGDWRRDGGRGYGGAAGGEGRGGARVGAREGESRAARGAGATPPHPPPPPAPISSAPTP